MMRWSLGDGISVVDLIQQFPEPARSRFAAFFDEAPGLVAFGTAPRIFQLASRTASTADGMATVIADLQYDGEQATQAELDKVTAAIRDWAAKNGIAVNYRGPGTLTYDLTAPATGVKDPPKVTRTEAGMGMGVVLLGVAAVAGVMILAR